MNHRPALVFSTVHVTQQSQNTFRPSVLILSASVQEKHSLNNPYFLRLQITKVASSPSLTGYRKLAYHTHQNNPCFNTSTTVPSQMTLPQMLPSMTFHQTY